MVGNEQNNFQNLNYEGCWENGLRNGQGKQTWKDGSQYEGNWVDD